MALEGANFAVSGLTLFLSSDLWNIKENLGPIYMTILEKISSKFQGKLKALDRKMDGIHSELVSVESSRIHLANRWQQRIREVNYDVEDLLDDLKIEEQSGHTSIKVPKLFPSKASVHNAIGVIKEKLGDLNKIYESIEVLVANEQLKEETMAVFEGREFIGRKKEKKEIVAFLLSENNNDDNNTCSIVGIGGVGKTALAQVVCQHKRVKKKLELKWVHVGFKKFDLREILFRIGGNVETNNTLEEQRIILEKTLVKKTRYLFVLDDLWHISRDDWSKLKSMLLNINKGNKFLITTRHQRIAERAAAKDKTVFLKPLEPDECLTLIKKFSGNKLDCLPETTGEEIIAECGGVPLALKTLGYKLLEKTTLKGLSEGTIRGSDIWSTEDVKEHGNIMNSLKCSYDYLPPRLKDCFAYHVVCNNILHKEKLTQMWTAQGFIEEPDVGNTAFEELQNASFFHDVEEHIFPGTPFKVLKLFRYLIHLVSKEYADTTESRITGVTRHVSLSPHAQKVQESRFFGQLRTVVGLPEIRLITQFKGLRVLVLFDVEFESKDISFSNLKHLRYLELSNNGDLEELPKSLGELLFLETLRIDMCKKLKSLPRNILPRSLKSLRINRCDELTKRCESEEGRDDVSLIKEVYLNGVLINPVPNVEPSPSSSSAGTDVLIKASNGGPNGNEEGSTHPHQSDGTPFGPGESTSKRKSSPSSSEIGSSKKKVASGSKSLGSQDIKEVNGNRSSESHRNANASSMNANNDVSTVTDKSKKLRKPSEDTVKDTRKRGREDEQYKDVEGDGAHNDRRSNTGNQEVKMQPPSQRDMSRDVQE